MPQLAFRQLIGASFSFQHFPFAFAAETMRGFGVTEIELWGIAQHLDLFHASDARVEQVRRVLADNGLSLRCFTPEQVIYPINIASGDTGLRRGSIDRFRRGAYICAALGGRYLFLTPGRGFENEAPAAAWARSVESLAEIAGHARTLGLRCLLEPLQRVESNIVTCASDLHRLFTELDADNVDIVLDTVAMATAGDTVAGYMRLFGDRIAHVHVVDGTPSGHLVWGDGALPLGRYIEDLAAAGYAGTLTFEPFGNGSYALDPVTAWRRNLDAIAPYLDRGTVTA
ncbi:TIM barrel protein [Bosea sp. 117]|uniref:sugar phosphate isomerase/epimerase family protein n=1 Tax=Bosea sp. 117 TaxID=1125973 RepID=UPI00049463BF|nr:TIM barrel protein [Bosea sp. 117]